MYWGKIIGTLAGLAVPGTVLSKIVLAVIGFMLGEQFGLELEVGACALAAHVHHPRR